MNILLLGAPTTDGYRAIGKDCKIFGGGWVENLIAALKSDSSLQLHVMFYCSLVKEVVFADYNGVTYIALPERVKALRSCNKKMIDDLSMVLKRVNPSIVHNIGTEREYNYQLLKLVGKKKFLLSITGLVSIIEHHYFADMSMRDYKRVSFGDILRGTSIINEQKLFSMYGRTEKKLLQEAKFIMGRTAWDYAYIRQLNPGAEYIHCGELLNPCFSSNQWKIEQAKRHTIFISQATYPIKGLHKMLEAMPLILSNYPDTRLIVGGGNIIGNGSIIENIKRTSYANHLLSLIKRYGLAECISFTGTITAEQMKEQYLKCNVFVMPSAIENSPNSLGEAMSLGVPIVASYVGGIPDMVQHQKSALLYDFNEPHMLAHHICSIFENDDLALSLGNEAKQRAKELFNREAVLKTTLRAYEKIMKQK